MGLFNRKANGGPLAKPVGLHVEFTGERTVATRTEVTDVPQLAAGVSLKERIVQQVRGGALTCKELAERLAVSEQEVRVTVNRHEEKLFAKLGSNPYRVGLRAKG